MYRFDIIAVGRLPDDFVAEGAAALASLGYTEAEIVPVLRKASSCKTVEEIIKFALR